ncbi:MAG: MBL fold metallo-hydrolase [Candidatus Latescibacteria bacterium]|nr:MBL fold metallo-hydrolase [Candidatus Latescibacterota bacterium]
MEILKGIHRIQTPLGTRSLYQHLLIDERCVLIDTGVTRTPEQVIIPYLKRVGLGPDRIDLALISHADADHFGGDESLRRVAPRALIACHELDVAWVEDPDRLVEERYNQFSEPHGMGLTPEERAGARGMMGGKVGVDLSLQGGEQIRMGERWRVEILHVPGHTQGHLMVYDPRSEAAIICDAALGSVIPDAEGNPSMPPTYCYPETYLPSIRKISALNPKHLLTSHYPAMRGREVQAFLRESLDFVRRVERAILSALRKTKGRMTMREIIDTVSSSLGKWPEEAAPQLAFPLAGHLNLLSKAKRIQKGRRKGLACWEIA